MHFYFHIKGEWNEDVCLFLIKYLKTANSSIKTDVLKTIIHGKNAHFTDLVSNYIIYKNNYMADSPGGPKNTNLAKKKHF